MYKKRFKSINRRDFSFLMSKFHLDKKTKTKMIEYRIYERTHTRTTAKLIDGKYKEKDEKEKRRKTKGSRGEEKGEKKAKGRNREML